MLLYIVRCFHIICFHMLDLVMILITVANKDLTIYLPV